MLCRRRLPWCGHGRDAASPTLALVRPADIRRLSFDIGRKMRRRGRTPMRGICRLLGAIVVAGGVWQALGGLGLATGQVATKQIALTEKQVERFIAAQRKMSAAKAENEFETIAKEYGFAGIE